MYASSAADSEMTRSRLEWAQWMGSKGFGVFIVRPGTKKPIDGYSWYSRQSSDPDRIAELFAATPDCNYAVFPGEEYVVIDLDIDPEKIGRTLRGLPIIGVEDLPAMLGGDTVVLAAVASRGARELIRAQLDGLGLVEGLGYWCVA